MKAVFIDIETNGLDSSIHVPLQIAIMIYDLKQDFLLSVDLYDVKCHLDEWALSDDRALEYNGINSLCLRWGEEKHLIGEKISKLLVKHNIVKGEAFFICQNPSFDRQFFNKLVSEKTLFSMDAPYHWLDLASMYWIIMQKELLNSNKPLNLSKDAIADFLQIPKEPKPHKALDGVMHLLDCYLAIKGKLELLK